MTEISVVPRATRYELLLTATQPISHHDPQVRDDSNRTLFNRRKELLGGSQVSSAALGQAELDQLCAAHPVPTDIAGIMAGLSGPEFIGVVLARLFIGIYNPRNGGDGEGLFSGIERYRFLEERLRHAAISASSLFGWWNRLCETLQVGIHNVEQDASLLPVLGLPKPTQGLVLEVLATQYRSVVSLARLWHSSAKDNAPTTVLALDASAAPDSSSEAQVVEVPTVSGNSLRHQCVREPGWHGLAEALGLEPGLPGAGKIPPGVEALFSNGGNIQAGVKAPSNQHRLAQDIRAAYPLLDLLGGVTNTFDLGASRLQVAGWVVCREHRDSIGAAADLPAASVSIFDLVDDITHTRQATRDGLGQMILSFEALCPGTQVLVRFLLDDYTQPLTHGAFVAAVERYIQSGPIVGGQRARGFGAMRAEWFGITPESHWAEGYATYISENRERLLDGLVTGRLCTETVVCT